MFLGCGESMREERVMLCVESPLEITKREWKGIQDYVWPNCCILSTTTLQSQNGEEQSPSLPHVLTIFTTYYSTWANGVLLPLLLLQPLWYRLAGWLLVDTPPKINSIMVHSCTYVHNLYARFPIWWLLLLAGKNLLALLHNDFDLNNNNEPRAI